MILSTSYLNNHCPNIYFYKFFRYFILFLFFYLQMWVQNTICFHLKEICIYKTKIFCGILPAQDFFFPVLFFLVCYFFLFILLLFSSMFHGVWKNISREIDDKAHKIPLATVCCIKLHTDIPNNDCFPMFLIFYVLKIYDSNVF